MIEKIGETIKDHELFGWMDDNPHVTETGREEWVNTEHYHWSLRKYYRIAVECVLVVTFVTKTHARIDGVI